MSGRFLVTLAKYRLMISELDVALGLKPVDERGWLLFADPWYESVNAVFGGQMAAVAPEPAATARPSALTSGGSRHATTP
jgi:hypothetical protein